jgi:hypothetical protein
MPTPIPIFAPVDNPGGAVVGTIEGAAEVVDEVFVDICGVGDEVDDVVAGLDVNAVISVLCHIAKMPSPKIETVPPAVPPRTVGDRPVEPVDCHSLFPILIGFLTE